MARVHQFVPTFEPGAVGAHMRAARGVLRDAGYESEIFAAEVHPAFSSEGAMAYGDYGRRVAARADDRLVYHLAIGSPVADFVGARQEPLIVDHHNLTPLRYLAGWEPVAAGGVLWGRRQLDKLAPRAALGIGDSTFNADELVDAGYPRTTVVPILLEPVASTDPDPALATRLAAGTTGARWLFVGRLAPNKAQHDVVKAFAAYRRFHDPGAHLDLVGGSSSVLYTTALRCFVADLGLDAAVNLAGGVSASELAAYYEAADVFVVLSEHEGFCVPVLEAMQHRVPVVAYGAAAVPETLANAGLVLDVKDPCTVAAGVARVVRDDALRAQLIAAGTQRRRDFDLDHTGPAFVAAVESVPVP
ncbi:MAG: glycosyltransferase family 4 protein [Acidimicrobiia bacterium]